jgi:hypothetical protein
MHHRSSYGIPGVIAEGTGEGGGGGLLCQSNEAQQQQGQDESGQA